MNSRRSAGPSSNRFFNSAPIRHFWTKMKDFWFSTSLLVGNRVGHKQSNNTSGFVVKWYVVVYFAPFCRILVPAYGDFLHALRDVDGDSVPAHYKIHLGCLFVVRCDCRREAIRGSSSARWREENGITQ